MKTPSVIVLSASLLVAPLPSFAAPPTEVGSTEEPETTSEPESTESTESECRPECRPGFTCIEGACVSACNPACPEGQACSATLECVALAPAPVLAASCQSDAQCIGPNVCEAGQCRVSEVQLGKLQRSARAHVIGGGSSMGLSVILAAGSATMFILGPSKDGQDGFYPGAYALSSFAAIAFTAGWITLAVGLVKQGKVNQLRTERARVRLGPDAALHF